jgi:hypothetical protein
VTGSGCVTASRVIDSAYVIARVNGSERVTASRVIDSAYVIARVNGSGCVTANRVIDSAYVIARVTGSGRVCVVVGACVTLIGIRSLWFIRLISLLACLLLRFTRAGRFDWLGGCG